MLKWVMDEWIHQNDWLVLIVSKDEAGRLSEENKEGALRRAIKTKHIPRGEANENGNEYEG